MKRELTYSGMGPMEVLPVELGGTGQSSNSGTIRDFNMLTIPELNATNGVLGYRPDGTIDPSFIPNDVYSLIPIHLEFEAEYATSTQVNLLITDFDSWTTYQVSADFNGQSINTTLNQETGVISLTTPSTVGQVLLSINGNTYYLNVVNMASVRVSKPSLLSPTNGSSNVNRTFQLLSSTMALSDGSLTQHDRSDWQVASDSAFTQLVFQSINDTSHKTSIEASITQPNTQYFARVRHHDAVYGLSPWSNTISFTSKSTFAVSSETAKLLASDGVSGDYLGEAGYGYGARGVFETLAVNDTGNIIAASIRRIGTNGNSQGGLFVWKKQNGGWTEVKKILSTPTTQAQTMTLTVPSGASITVQIQGQSPPTTTYTSSQVITIPKGTTTVILTGKGQDGSTVQDTIHPLIWQQQSSGSVSYYISGNGYFSETYRPAYPTKLGETFTEREGYWNNTENSVVVPLMTTVWLSVANMLQVTGQSATATINGQTFTFAGGVGVNAVQSTQKYTVANYGYFARNLSVKSATKNMGGEALALNIPNGGSINVAFAGQSPSTSTYTSSQVLSVPVGTTQITLTGKGQDGSSVTTPASGSVDYIYGPQNQNNNAAKAVVITTQANDLSTQLGFAVLPTSLHVTSTEHSTLRQLANSSAGGYNIAAGRLDIPVTFNGQSLIARFAGHFNFQSGQLAVVGQEQGYFDTTGAVQLYHQDGTLYTNGTVFASFTDLVSGTNQPPSSGTGDSQARFVLSSLPNYTPPVTTETTGLSSTATIAGQTYTFSGGVGIPAQQSSSIIQSYENRMAVLNVTSMNNTQFTYDLIFYKEVGNDWTVAKTFSNIGVGKAAELTFKFSKDGNTFILSDVVNNRLLVYTYTSDWNTPTVINLNTYGITLSASLAVRYHVTVNADGSRIGVVLLDSASTRHFVALSLTGGSWIKSYQYDFPTNDFVDCLYGNDDFSIFCGLCTTGSYPVVNVYTFNGVALTKVQAIEPPETDKVYSTFGASIDISSNGNTIAISSLHFNASSQQSSTALIHIFERSTIWTLARSVSPSDIALEDRFGIEIDLSGDASTLISNGWSGTPRNNLGAVYVFN